MAALTRSSSARLFGALAVLVALIASLIPASPARAATGAPSEEATTQTISFQTTLRAKYKDEHSDGDITYGVTVLRGKTRIAKKKVKVERISVYNYTNGSGPITGFLGLTWAKGTHLAFTVSGQSQAVDGTTVISGDLVLFDTAGKYAGYTGYGTMTGTRNGAIGTPVTYTFNLTLKPGA